MKKNTIKKAPRPSLVSRSYLLNNCLPLFIFMIAAFVVEGQELKNTFSKEITIVSGGSITTKGPLHMDFEMNGRIAMDWNNKFYQIIPGGNDGVSALLIRDYQIFTWAKNTVKQEVEISILPDENAPLEAKQLMEALSLTLVENASGAIVIDDNLNIQKFGFTNGFLKRNTNKITLENGKAYRMKGITIKSTLHIPKASNLTLSSKYLGVSLGDLDGKLHLDLQNAAITAGDVKELAANLDFCEASFKQLGKVVVNCKKTTFIAESIEKMTVGSNDLAGQAIYKCNLHGRGAKSSLSKYSLQSVEEIEILETTNDNFAVGNVKNMKANYSTFSNFEIGKLEESLYLNAKNGDLRINELAANFKKVELDNHISSIHLNMKASPNYRIKLQENEYTELDFSENIKRLKQNDAQVYLKGKEATAGKIDISCNSCKISIQE